MKGKSFSNENVTVFCADPGRDFGKKPWTKTLLFLCKKLLYENYNVNALREGHRWPYQTDFCHQQNLWEGRKYKRKKSENGWGGVKIVGWPEECNFGCTKAAFRRSVHKWRPKFSKKIYKIESPSGRLLWMLPEGKIDKSMITLKNAEKH